MGVNVNSHPQIGSILIGITIISQMVMFLQSVQNWTQNRPKSECENTIESVNSFCLNPLFGWNSTHHNMFINLVNETNFKHILYD